MSPTAKSGSLPEGIDVRIDSPGCLAVYQGPTMIGWVHDQRGGQWSAYVRQRHGANATGISLGVSDRDAAIAGIVNAFRGVERP